MSYQRLFSVVCAIAAFSCGPLWAGVGDAVKNEYRQEYLNRTFFLKLPLYGARYEVMVRPGGLTPIDTANQRLSFRVGEQVRITGLDFGNQEIKFKVSSIDLARENELVYRFPVQLDEAFPQRPNFEEALDETFTEGLSNREIEAAKRQYLRREFGRLVGEMARTTESDRSFVIESVAEEIPGVQRAKQRADQAEEKAERLESRLAEEKKAREEAESRLAQLRRESSRNESSIDTLKQEREDLLEENSELERRVRQLESQSRQYKDQIDRLASSLDLRTSANTDLSRSISQLNETVDNLKAERDRLTRELTQAREDFQEKKEEAEKLSGTLSRTRRERNQLRSQIKDLTSNKNSLESRYVEAQSAQESFQTAAKLEQALRLRADPSSLAGDGPLVRHLYLNDHKVATLQVDPPSEPGRLYNVAFSLDSPDTVAFSEEERELYAALGESWTVKADYRTSSDTLSAVLLEGEAKRSVGPREAGRWQFNFTGSLDEPAQAVLSTALITAEGRSVRLGDQTFVVRGGGVLALTGQPFSPLWLIVGAILGVALMLPVLFLRSKAPPGKRPAKSGKPPSKKPKARSEEPGESESYVPHKRL